MKNQNDYKEGKEVLATIADKCEILYDENRTVNRYYVTEKGSHMIARCLETYHEAVSYACNYLGLIKK